MEVAASVIAVLQLSSKVIGYLTDVKDASKERTTCAMEVTNLHSLLLNLRFHLEGQNTDDSWFVAIRALAVENGPLDQFKQALLTLQARMTDRGRLQMAKDALLWKFEKEEMASVLHRVERLKTLVEIALLRDHFKLSQAIQGDIRTIKTDTEIIKGNTKVIEENTQIIKSDINFVRAHGNEADHHKLLEWISPSNYPAQHSDIIKRRQNGTGQWFLSAAQFSRWLSEPRATLFCPGIPGAGKTMVAAIAIEHLLTSVKSSTVGVAYIYCDYKVQEEDNASELLAAILKQLAETQMEPVERLHKLHKEKGSRPSSDKIFNTLRDVISQYDSVFIVVDALDECQGSHGSWRQLLDRIRDLQALCNVHLLATSRFIPEIEKSFNSAPVLVVQADNEDVQRFVAGQLHRLPKCVQNDTELQVKVKQKISDAVGGMFLLARLYVDSLLDKRSKAKVISTLDGLHGGSEALNKAYDEAINRIQGQLPGDVVLAKRALSWITTAMRPLSVTEICHGLAVEPETKDLDLDNVSDIDDIVSVCAGLVSVDETSKIVRLVHYTTQKYFEQKLETWKPDAQLDIAQACLTYLSFDQFTTTISDYDHAWDLIFRYQFLEYAAQHWGHHASFVQNEVRGLAYSVLHHEALLSCAVKVASILENESPGLTERRTDMHILARFGLCILLTESMSAMQKPASVTLDAKDSRDRSPLSFAAQFGHVGAVVLLLDNGADIETKGKVYVNPLQTAALFTQEPTVRLLLDRGANVNAEGGYYGTALQSAAYRGHDNIVKLLLDRGAEINVGGSFCGTALQAAAFNGHEKILRLLRGMGAEIDVHNKRFGSALQIAAFRGHDQIVIYLLNEGADINCKVGEIGTALQSASQSGHISIVQLLLDAGAEVNTRSDNGRTALITASEWNRTQIIQLLLDKGANTSTRDDYYGTALQSAIFKGSASAVRLLIRAGADVNARGGVHGHALHPILTSNNERYDADSAEEIVKLLLEAGADANVEGGSYSHALLAASHRGHVVAVKMLLDAATNIHGGSELFNNALQAVAYAGHLEMLELLMTRYSVAQFHDPHGRSLLWWAAAGGRLWMARFLVEKYNFDPHTPNVFGQTPFWIASQKGHIATSVFLGTVRGKKSPPEEAPSKDDGDETYFSCDICTRKLRTKAVSFHCDSCLNGDWDMCADCESSGAHCEDSAHILVKRTRKDDEWVEVVDETH